MPSIGDTGYGAQPVKATCSVNTNQTVLDCELASSENRSLGQIANVSIDNGFLSARSGIIRERWAFETASDNWYTYPWQDNWDFRHDAKAVIASFRAAAKQATDVDIIAETWRTGPLFKGIPDDFARRNGVWYSTFRSLKLRCIGSRSSTRLIQMPKTNQCRRRVLFWR